MERIILSGKYAYDLALRFEYAGITTAEVVVEPDLDKMVGLLRELPETQLYCVTCFSDKEKLLSRCQVL